MLHRIDASGRATWTVTATLAVAGTLLSLLPAQRGGGAPPPMPCANATAPMCAGSCPAGLRCVSLIDGTLAMAGVGPAPASSAQNGPTGSGAFVADQCGCMEVLCGGTPIGNDQSCCSGVPFTLGTQGCCRGVVVAATEPCNCSGTYESDAFLFGSPPDDIDFPTESCCADNGTVFASAGPANQTGCCLRDGLAVEYSLNSGYDCCPPSGPDFCFGRCEQGECVTDDCCNCSECDEGPEEVCKLPGSTLEFCSDALDCQSQFRSNDGPLDAGVPCDVVCFQNGPTCSGDELIENASCLDCGCDVTCTPTVTPTVTPSATPTNTPLRGDGEPCATPGDCMSGNCVDDVCCDTACDQPGEVCNLEGEEGTCVQVAAPAPTASPRGLLVLVLALIAVAAWALLRNGRMRQYLWSL